MNGMALERPDLIWNAPRTINMSTIGNALLDANDPPIRALFVYNSNPVAVAPESSKVVAGFAREDLFCVVHDVFLTDTADYADIVLPATTQLEHIDIHSSYGHLYALANNAAIAPLGEAKPNTEVFRLLAARMGFDEPCFRESDEEMARNAFLPDHPRAQGLSWDTLKEKGWQRLNVPSPFAPFARGNFPTPSGKCEFYSQTLADQGLDPLPTFIPPRESAASNPVLSRKYPLAMLSPPARNALNSTFANLPVFLDAEKTPSLDIHPADAASRGIDDGDRVRVFNDRGSMMAAAQITDKARPGVVVALSIWWRKLSPDGTNANMLTGQALTDMGRAATFSHWPMRSRHAALLGLTVPRGMLSPSRLAWRPISSAPLSSELLTQYTRPKEKSPALFVCPARRDSQGRSAPSKSRRRKAGKTTSLLRRNGFLRCRRAPCAGSAVSDV